MNKFLLPVYIISLVFFCSCQSQPSKSEIARKILIEYTCAETAKINSLEVIKSAPATSLSGLKGYEYIVSGEVEWPIGCTDFGTALPAGYKEKFDNKRVVLIKGEDGWQ